MIVTTMQMRTALLIGSLSLGAGWMLHGSPASQPAGPATSQGTATRRGPHPLGVEPGQQSAAAPRRRVTASQQEPAAPYTEQLRQKMQDIPRSPMPGRNPFAFGVRPAPAPSKTPRNVEAAAVELPSVAPVMPARVRFQLSGIASTNHDGKATLTAILMDGGSMVFAVAGEKLSGGYVVTSISETSIVIADAAGVEQTISLKQ